MTPTLLLASTEAHSVPLPLTLVFAAVLLGMILSLALEEKIHAKKSLIAGVFAVISLLLGTAFHLLPFGPVEVGGHEIEMPVYIPAVDWGVIAIILGSSLFIDVTSKSGLFTWIAIKLTKASRGEPRRLLWFYGLMTVVFSAVLNNVTAMLIVGSLTGVSLKKLGRQQYLLGFLIVEGLLTNIGGLLTLISSVPNIIVGTAANISFVEFFYKSSPYVAVATVVTVLMGIKLFDIEALASDDERAEAAEQVASFDENDGIESRGFLFVPGHPFPGGRTLVPLVLGREVEPLSFRGRPVFRLQNHTVALLHPASAEEGMKGSLPTSGRTGERKEKAGGVLLRHGHRRDMGSHALDDEGQEMLPGLDA